MKRRRNCPSSSLPHDINRLNRKKEAKQK